MAFLLMSGRSSLCRILHKLVKVSVHQHTQKSAEAENMTEQFCSAEFCVANRGNDIVKNFAQCMSWRALSGRTIYTRRAYRRGTLRRILHRVSCYVWIVIVAVVTIYWSSYFQKQRLRQIWTRVYVKEDCFSKHSAEFCGKKYLPANLQEG